MLAPTSRFSGCDGHEFSDPTDIDELSADCEEPKLRKKG
jgi:hypothetical protein